MSEPPSQYCRSQSGEGRGGAGETIQLPGDSLTSFGSQAEEEGTVELVIISDDLTSYGNTEQPAEVGTGKSEGAWAVESPSTSEGCAVQGLKSARLPQVDMVDPISQHNRFRRRRTEEAKSVMHSPSPSEDHSPLGGGG